MAAKIVEAIQGPVGQDHPIVEIVLIPSKGGVFEVEADGQLIFSKRETGKHAAEADIINSIRRIAAVQE